MAHLAEPIQLKGRQRHRAVSDDAHHEPTEQSSEAPLRRDRRRQRLAWILAAVVLMGTAGVAWWVGSNTQSPDQAAARAAEPEASWVTSPVEFRVLSSTLVTRGDVRPEARTEVRSPSSVEGDPVLTQSVVTAGDVVAEGDRVVEVSGRPVFVLQGDTPVYRSLQPGMTGDDVSALQVSLVRLGHRIDDSETGTYGESTKAAVTDFYTAAGYSAVPTSETYPADLAAAERAVSDADAGVATAQGALDDASDGPAGSAVAQADEAVASARRQLEVANANVVTDVQLARSAVDIAKASRNVIQDKPDVSLDEWNAANTAVSVAEIALSDAIRDTDDAVDAAQAALDIAVLARQELDTQTSTLELQTTLDVAIGVRDDANAALRELVRVNGPTVAQGEAVFVTSTPSRVLAAATTATSTDAASNQSEATGVGEALVSLASGNLVVSAVVNVSDAELVSTGLDVEILDELTDTVYPATVATVADRATTGADGQVGHTVTIRTANPLPDSLAGTNVRVTMTAASTGIQELVVPLAAVSSSADGSTRVSVVDPDTNEPVEIAVTAGLSADGFVAVEPVDPGALVEGNKVIVGR